MKKYLLSAFAIVALLCIACGGDDAPTTVPVSGIKLDKSALSLEIGEKATVTATIAPADATNKSITWSTANQTIATVNNGVVTGVATGETTLTAKTNDGGYSVTIPVKVVAQSVKVTAIKLVGVPTEAKEGRSTTISAVITPTDATDMTVTFTSSNPDVVKVEFTKSESNYSLATLTAVGPGKAKITATANDGSGVTATSEEITVSPTIKVSDISLVVSKSEVKVGYMVRATATISPEDAENKEIKWSSSNPYIAKLKAVEGANNKVDIIGVSPGTATITATAKDGSGVKATAEVEVIGVIPTAVTFDGQSKDKIFVTWHGKEVDLKAVATPANGDLTSLHWSAYTWTGHDGAFSYNVTKDKVTAVTIIPTDETTPQDVRTYVSVAKDENSAEMAKCSVVSRCKFWACDSTDGTTIGDQIMPLHFGPQFFHQETYFRWDATGDSAYKNGWYFVATCPPIKYGLNAALDYYKDSSIPTSEYTLTSSSSNVKITRTSDNLYKVGRLKWDTYEELTLTYTCGDYVYKVPVRLIP